LQVAVAVALPLKFEFEFSRDIDQRRKACRYFTREAETKIPQGGNSGNFAAGRKFRKVATLSSSWQLHGKIGNFGGAI